MPEKREKLLEQLNTYSKYRRSLWQIVTSLSLIVIVIVFWSLKLTGIGIAGEAFCGKSEHSHNDQCLTKERICTFEETAEHTHTEECYKQLDECPLEEHIHDETCYSNIHADLETSDDWELTLADIARGPTTKENVVLVAKSQLGYTESTLNFQVDASGIRRGITRYGQWYGNPYGDWSAMFVSFCLEYAGATGLPMNAGPEAMRLEWESIGLYQAATQTAPEVGHLIFLHKGESEYAGANAVAIITDIDENIVTVIEGDWEDTVVQTQYVLDDEAIMGYGLTPEADAISTLDAPAVIAEDCTIWLDGTDGGLSYLTGSPNSAYTAQVGSTIQLPDTWTSPSKYSYKLHGWYDITNHQYYPAGGEMEVTGNAVLYADWVAATYDIGEFNAYVADTVSTNDFITTHLFDYNSLFNLRSVRANATVSATGHAETWSLVSNGNVGYLDQQTLDFIFTNGAPSYQDGYLCYPSNRDDANNYPGEGIVTSGIYSERRVQEVFSLEDSLGKKYLGTADHLFQIMTDPNDPYYGYYYYDSQRNAASYNQSQSRFYVYEYLESPSDSVGSTNSGFMPLNSPYANTNGNNTNTYTYDGINGEYAGVNHFEYTSAYSDGNEVLANFAYGMRTDIRFYLPDDTGTNGNKDLYGNDMHFHFSGDDDVWVLIDGELVLDIGGIHSVASGDINFSTGQVTVQDAVVGTFNIPAGEHVMTILYLERGASQSNCAIYFNLAPRYSLDIQKEDVLTQRLLDGTQFSVYTDAACTVPVEFYTSEDAYRRGEATTNTFTVTNGVAHMWGLSPSKVYYIKETGPPAAEGYGLSQGTIRVTIEKGGISTYHVEVVDDPSPGFTVHGVNINEETKKVHIVVTNAPETVIETTTVQVIKEWGDTADHSRDYISAYLTVTDPDGTVRRIREVILSDENDWMYVWTNLPKYDYDALTEVQYGIEESYESGYYSTVRRITQIVIEKTQWAESLSFQNGETYILRSASGYLSTINNNSDTGYKWVDEQTAKASSNALWTATVVSGKVKFTNGVGQTITLYYNGGSPTDFYARIPAPQSQDRQEFSYSSSSGGLQIFYQQGNNRYYMTSSMNSSGKFGYSTNQNNSLILTPVCQITQSDIRDVEDWAYQVTNTPLAANNETSLSVSKHWEIPEGYDAKLYQEFAVTVRLFANGVNTGRSMTLTLKNNWQGVFQGLPYKDADGNVIAYTVDEVWEKPKWTTSYGEILSFGGSPPTYSTVITNTYHPGGPELPSTGSAARMLYVLCGSAIMLGTLVYGIGSRRKRERRMK